MASSVVKQNNYFEKKFLVSTSTCQQLISQHTLQQWLSSEMDGTSWQTTLLQKGC